MDPIEPSSFEPQRDSGQLDPSSTNVLNRASSRSRKPRVAIVLNAFTPYRIHTHQRICDEIPDAEFWSLATHSPSFGRWRDLQIPRSIRPVHFGNGEPSNEQTRQRFALREWRKAGRIIEWLHRNRIDAVFCQGYGDFGRLRLIRWCHQNHVPCFLYGDSNVHGDALRPVKRLLKRALVRQATRWCDGVMVCGTTGRTLFEQCGVSGSRMFPFPWMPDTTLFHDPPQDAIARVGAQYQIDPSRRRWLFSGRFVQDKRPDVLISAFIQIADERPDWDLLMVGDGPMAAELRAMVPPELKGRIQWTGLIGDSHDLAGLFAVCDQLVLPSQHEPWGVVIIEAAAAGMGIITTDVVGAAADIVHHQRNGFVVPPSDVKALANAMLASSEPDVRDRFGDQSRQVLMQWSQQADPILGLRQALTKCQLLKPDSKFPISVDRTADNRSQSSRPPESRLRPINSESSIPQDTTA